MVGDQGLRPSQQAAELADPAVAVCEFGQEPPAQRVGGQLQKAGRRQLALPAGELREAAPKLLRFRLLHVHGRLTRGQRKRWLHLRADWPWTTDLINAWHAVRALPAPP